MDANTGRDRCRLVDGLTDPRIDRTKHHSLEAILVIALLAVIGGADGWTQVAMFGRSKRKWLETFLDLPHGIPSHDTFGRVFSMLDPDELERFFVQWTAHLAKITQGQLIAIDGKTLRRSFDKANRKAAIHMVSAWSSANQLVFGQFATDAKSNEITAIPRLLKLLDLTGAVVTIDATSGDGVSEEDRRTDHRAGWRLCIAGQGQPQDAARGCEAVVRSSHHA